MIPDLPIDAWFAIAASLIVLQVVILIVLFLLYRRQARSGWAEVMAMQLEALDQLPVLVQGQERLARELDEALAQGRIEAGETARRDRESFTRQSAQLGELLSAQVSDLGHLQARQFDALAGQIHHMTAGGTQQAEALRALLDERLQAIQRDNAEKLETMRRTVDEKLHVTLEQRLGDSFRLVSERLEQVHRSLGEVHDLAAGVGDLKRVLTNIKTRGIWGEVQLAALLEQVLTPEQYVANVAPRPNSAQRVEFALRLPGKTDTPVWLPIDAKFPLEDYLRLQDAQQLADTAAIEQCARALERRLQEEARKIRDSYIEPPHTTDFAILYLPTEGLYAEVLRRPGLAESLQSRFRVMLAGPMTLAALLNSLQMGFRTLAIEQRSSEVWALLGAVRSEFGKFGIVLASTKKKLMQATDSIDAAEVRTRAIERQLHSVEVLPVREAVVPLHLEEDQKEEI